MYHVFILAALFVVAFGSTAKGQVPDVVPAASEVDEYDIGIHVNTPIDDPVRLIPEGKADTLIVYSAAWCVPCQVARPMWRALRAEGYKVVYIDIDDPHAHDGEWDYQTAQLVDMMMEVRPTAVPTIRWYNSEKQDVIAETTGRPSTSTVKEKLWKPSSSQDLRRAPLPLSSVRPPSWHGLETHAE